jgi:hypothetical protein
MDLTPGTRVGPYEVTGSLGAGGMGEVYRARDTRLHRDVALKILPAAFAGDSERLARFEREAQLLASLNHPHIAIIYGIEETAGTRALVLEVVEGDTLADRLAAARGAGLPANEALSIAVQIAEGLQAAHDHGIVHRDLKPANIKITPESTVKVLDFGLAKAFIPEGSGSSRVHGAEQARGRLADKRSDIWSFGCVLYEMLTGKRPFAGDDVSDTLATVLKVDPDWSALPPEVPPAIRALLRGCLQKDRSKRVGDIAAALFALRDTSAQPEPHRGDAQRRGGRRALAIGAIAMLAGAAIGMPIVLVTTRSAPLRVERFALAPTGPSAVAINGVDRDLAITPDGSRVVYVGSNGTQVFVRPLAELESTVIATGGAYRAIHAEPSDVTSGHHAADAWPEPRRGAAPADAIQRARRHRLAGGPVVGL